MKKICFHKYIYINHSHVTERLPDDVKGILCLYFRCNKCGKEKYKAYLENISTI